MESGLQEIAGPPPSDAPPGLRAAPAPRHGGLVTLLRFMRRPPMLNAEYARLVARPGRRRYLTPYGRRLELEGIAFIGPKVVLQIGPAARVHLGRWSWLARGAKEGRP